MTTNDDDNFDPRWKGWAIRKPTWHFHQTLLARYGIVLKPGEFSQMLRDIKSGSARLVERQSPTKAVYLVRLQRSWERVFVLVDGEHVITAMPPKKRLIRKRKELPD